MLYTFPLVSMCIYNKEDYCMWIYVVISIPNNTGNGSLNRECHLALPEANELI